MDSMIPSGAAGWGFRAGQLVDPPASSVRRTSLPTGWGPLPYRIVYEYQEPGVHQIILDPEQLFGYLITFMQRTG